MNNHFFFFSVKPFQSGFNLTVPKLATTAPPSPAWLGRSIATRKLRLLEFSAFVDQQVRERGRGQMGNGENTRETDRAPCSIDSLNSGMIRIGSKITL